MVDIRGERENVIQTNKKHQAGVTFLKEMGENTLLTGSYDCTLKLWDARKITQELEECNTSRQIWDLNFSKEGP